MGAYGLRPVVEIQFADYFYPAADQIFSEAARLRYRSAGGFTAPLTIRMPCGGGIFGGQTHSQSPEALFTHVGGLRTVMPSNPYDAKGLLIAPSNAMILSSFWSPNVCITGRSTASTTSRSCPGPSIRWATCPRAITPCRWTRPRSIAKANDLTVLTYGTMVYVAEVAAREAGIEADIIDLRSLWPLDMDAVLASVRKTGRCVVLHEATRTSGFGAELCSLVQEHCFYHLEAPIERIAGWDTPYPHSHEWAYFPGPTGGRGIRTWVGRSGRGRL